MKDGFFFFFFIQTPGRLSDLRLSDWNVLIRQARYAGLLGKLYQLTLGLDISSEILEKITPHLLSTQIIVNKQRDGLHCELVKLPPIFEDINIPLILLKGGAYYVLGLPFSASRMLSDIDLLVPKQALPRVEAALAVQGWQSQSKDAYDEHYYREWMHEIPPLVHRKRKSVLDVHHTILPPTTKYNRDPEKIMAAAREVSPGIWTLCPEDLVIHSATHLFHDGELEHGLRDLVDIHELLQYFAENEAGFWTRLVPRAIELDLFLPLYYGLYYAQTILNTAIPESVMQHVSQGAPNKMMRPIMDWLFLRALRSAHSSCDLFGTGFARWILYVRSHYLRMPLTLLIPHLIRKAWKRRFKDKAEEPNEFLRGAPTDRDPLV